MMLSQIVVDRFLRNEISNQYDLHAYEKLIMFFLASYMGSNSNCYPSLKLLAINCSVSVDSIKRGIKSLEEKKLIKVTRNAGRSNHYSFNLSNRTPPSADSTQCPQHLDANSTISLVPTAPGGSAHSTPNNINNNIKEYTSLNLKEVNTSEVSISKNDFAAGKQIFEYWKRTMNHPRAKLDKKREQAIERAFKLGYSVNELEQAINGCATSPFHMGKNDSHKVYDDIGLIFRDAKHIEGFMNNSVNNDTGVAFITSNDLMAGVI